MKYTVLLLIVAVSFAAGQYGKPQPAYGKPQPAYGKPQPAYGKPQPAYGKPQPAYGKPQPAYEKPQPAYGKPQPKAPAYGYDDYGYGKPQPKESSSKSSSNYVAGKDNGKAYKEENVKDYQYEDNYYDAGDKKQANTATSYKAGGDSQEYGSADQKYDSYAKDFGHYEEDSYGKDNGGAKYYDQYADEKKYGNEYSKNSGEYNKYVDQGGNHGNSYLDKYGKESGNSYSDDRDYASKGSNFQDFSDSSAYAQSGYETGASKKSYDFAADKKSAIDYGKSYEAGDKYNAKNDYGYDGYNAGKSSDKYGKDVDYGNQYAKSAVNKYGNEESEFGKYNSEFANSNKYYTEENDYSDYSQESKTGYQNQKEYGLKAGIQQAKDNGKIATSASKSSEQYYKY